MEPTRARETGVLCAQGDWNNGWALLALDGRLAYVLNRFGVTHRVVADQPIPAGTTELRAEYTREDPGGKPGQGEVEDSEEHGDDHDAAQIPHVEAGEQPGGQPDREHQDQPG